ncbi:MAG: hypothetical protein JW993_10270 [Sedimentisphaerales bacterium]|nr:hypothetical protein [Sedimentisphaerales bacterium]
MPEILSSLPWLKGPIPDSVVLNPGDEIWLRYQMIDSGSWLEQTMVAQIETELRADLRVELVRTIRESGYDLSPHYPVVSDPSDVGASPVTEPQYITFVCRALPASDSDQPADPRAGGVMPWPLKAVLIASAIALAGYATWVYSNRIEYVMKPAVATLQETAQDPNATPAERETAIKALGEIADTSIVGEVASGLGSSFALLVGLAVLYLLFGRD